MAEVTLTINGRNYGISCEDGQEQRVVDLGQYVDRRLKEISKAGAAANESHLLVLTALMLADEIYDLRENIGVLGDEVEQSTAFKKDETIIIQAIDQLADRIDHIADRIQKA